MSSEKKPKATDTQSSLSTPTRSQTHSMTSIARSISWGYWWRRLFGWLVLDICVLGGLLCAYAFHCIAITPELASHSVWMLIRNMSLVAGVELDLRAWQLVLTAAGKAYSFYLVDALPMFLPVLVVLGVLQLVSLFGIVRETRRVRRKLQPLQTLAITAEAMGNAALADPMQNYDTNKIATLEQAINRANADSPMVSTGDKELQSIEIALNGLLRQMQEAKLQQMRFVSDASHELRTPIAVIQGYVQMLARWGKSDAKVLDESIEALELETDHMQELVEQLLFLARGDSGRNTLRSEPFNLARVVHEVFEESDMIDAKHSYECSVSEADQHDERFVFVGDEALIKQSMRILVQNAERYSAEGSSIELGVEADDTGLFYTVRDEGIGMSAADAEHIFERFYRADGARNESGEGSGLGLSIAKWIVDAHGGTIEVISREGVGTRFTVRLPRTGTSIQVSSR